MKKAVIAGASGLVGGHLLEIILNDSYYQEVLVLTRKEIPIQHKKLVQLVIDFDKLNLHAEAITGDAIFCCLGSTRKKTPNLSDYRKVDFDYPVKMGEIAKNNGIGQYHLVSSIGANMHSGNFYTKLKGETEYALINLALPCLHIYQPSALTGERKDRGLLEKFVLGIMSVIDPILLGSLKKYRSIAAKTVAQAMYNQSFKAEDGLFIHPSDHIKKLA